MPPLEEAEEAARRDREARSLALEKTYVHDVYRQKARQFTESRHRLWPRVRQFLAELEPGSLVCDVGQLPWEIDIRQSLTVPPVTMGDWVIHR